MRMNNNYHLMIVFPKNSLIAESCKKIHPLRDLSRSSTNRKTFTYELKKNSNPTQCSEILNLSLKIFTIQAFLE